MKLMAKVMLAVGLLIVISSGQLAIAEMLGPPYSGAEDYHAEAWEDDG